MCPTESLLKDLPALPCSLVLENSFPGVLSTNSLTSWSLTFLKLSFLILCLSSIPQECEVHHCMITTASSPDVTHLFTCVSEKQVQYCICPSGAVYYLAQEVIFDAFQEPWLTALLFQQMQGD